jgi:hypothetical protein
VQCGWRAKAEGEEEGGGGEEEKKGKCRHGILLLGIYSFEIYWLRNGRPLAPTPRSQTHYGGTMALLKISMMTPEDSGEYSIVAENQHGRVSSLNQSLLTVFSKDHIPSISCSFCNGLWSLKRIRQERKNKFFNPLKFFFHGPIQLVGIFICTSFSSTFTATANCSLFL